jgi:hypothetical protein
MLLSAEMLRPIETISPAILAEITDWPLLPDRGERRMPDGVKAPAAVAPIG